MSLPCEVAMQIPEDQLAARCRAGDLEAFGQVYARYERLVFRYAYRLLGHQEDARDIKQETFLRAYQALPGFRGQCSLRAWLLRICRNLCRDRLRSWERRTEVLYDPTTPDLWSGTGPTDPHALAEQSQMAELLRCALRGLPAAQREIILLRDIEEFSVEEVAQILGCTRTTVNVRLYRARLRLKERVRALLEPRG